MAFSAFAHAARAAFLPIDDATLQTVTPRRVPGTAGAPGMAFAGDDDDELERVRAAALCPLLPQMLVAR